MIRFIGLAASPSSRAQGWLPRIAAISYLSTSRIYRWPAAIGSHAARGIVGGGEDGGWRVGNVRARCIICGAPCVSLRVRTRLCENALRASLPRRRGRGGGAGRGEHHSALRSDRDSKNDAERIGRTEAPDRSRYTKGTNAQVRCLHAHFLLDLLLLAYAFFCLLSLGVTQHNTRCLPLGRRVSILLFPVAAAQEYGHDRETRSASLDECTQAM